MSSFSPYLEKAVLDHVLGTAAFTAPSAVYVALSSTDPGADGSSITEPTYTGYARQEATFSAATGGRSEEHTSELQSRGHLVCRLLLVTKNDSTHRHA